MCFIQLATAIIQFCTILFRAFKTCAVTRKKLAAILNHLKSVLREATGLIATAVDPTTSMNRQLTFIVNETQTYRQLRYAS